MGARFLLVASLFAFAGLAGCAVRAADVETFGAMDAVEAAWEKARAVDESAQLLSVRASEGKQWQLPMHGKDPTAGDDTGGDGQVGDGEAGSWVVSFRAGESVLSVRTYADGRDPIVHTEPVVPMEHAGFVPPEGGNRGPKSTDSSSWLLDSGETAAIVGALPEFQEHAAAYPEAGYAYTYLPYSAARTLYDYQMSFGSTMAPEFEERGWMVGGNVWIVTHLDAEAIERGEVPTMATAVVDAATSKVLMVSVYVPRFFQELLALQEQFDDPLPPSGLAPAVHEVPFEVPAGTKSMGGILWCYESVGLLIGPSVDPVRCELVDPEGNVALAGQDPFGGGFSELDMPAPLAGTWTLRITHDTPIPRSTSVTAILYGSVPIYFLDPPADD